MNGQIKVQLCTSMNVDSLLLVTRYEGVLPGHKNSQQCDDRCDNASHALTNLVL